MAHNPKISTHLASQAALGELANFAAGKLRIYDGSQPADADTAITTQNLLVEITLASPAFSEGGNGVLTALGVPLSGTGIYASTAAWYRVVESDGTTKLMDGTVGVGATFDCNIDSVTIGVGTAVNLNSFTHTVTKG